MVGGRRRECQRSRESIDGGLLGKGKSECEGRWFEATTRPCREGSVCLHINALLRPCATLRRPGPWDKRLGGTWGAEPRKDASNGNCSFRGTFPASPTCKVCQLEACIGRNY